MGVNKVTFTIESGTPVSILPKSLVPGDLRASEERLCAYGGSVLNMLGTKCVRVSSHSQSICVNVHVVPHGGALMSLDLTAVFNV